MAKAKPKAFTVRIPLYKCDIVVIAGHPFEWVQKHYAKAYPCLNDPPEFAEGMVFRKAGSAACGIWWKDARPGGGIAAHEIFHAACTILWNRSIELNGATEEAFAYLIEYLTREIGKRLW